MEIINGVPAGGASSATLPFTTSSDPASSAATTTAIVNAYGGVVITLTGAGNAQTIGAPTVITAGKTFTVVNNDTSANAIVVNGVTIPAGKAQTWVWDGSAWSEIDLGSTGHTIQNATTPLTTRANLNFTGAGVVASDNAGTGSTDVTIAGGGGAGIAWSIITADPGPAIKSNGYLCNTTAAGFTVTLPASPTLGDEIAFADYAGLFDSKNLTIGRNTKKIMGLAEDMVVSTRNAAFSLIYSDVTGGWRIK
jgi:hypothetical protein